MFTLPLKSLWSVFFVFFYQQESIKWIKSDGKDFYIVTKKSTSKN